MPDLVKTYGDQGITGFWLTGAINSGGSSDQIDWWEEGRRHRSFTIAATCPSDAPILRVTDATFQDNVQVNDVVMEAKTGARFIVQAGGVLANGTSQT